MTLRAPSALAAATSASMPPPCSAEALPPQTSVGCSTLDDEPLHATTVRARQTTANATMRRTADRLGGRTRFLTSVAEAMRQVLGGLARAAHDRGLSRGREPVRRAADV